MIQGEPNLAIIDLTKPEEQVKLTAAIAVWERIVQVQMHFNDISLRIRNFLITVILATLGAAGFSLHNGIKLFTIGEFSVSPLPFLFAAAWLAIFLLYFMDRDWYHRLLKGAVDASIPISDRYGQLIPGLSLGEKISAASKLRIHDRWWLRLARRVRLISTVDGDRTDPMVPSIGKLEFFYRSALTMMALSACMSLFGGVYVNETWWLLACFGSK